MNKRSLIIIAVIVVGIVGFFFLTKPKSNSTGNGANGATPTSHYRGPESAKATLVEYGDFECPGCGQYYPVLKQLEAEFGDSLRVQFRNFPLTQLHVNALAAHRAAEAADKQGKFWEMHDQLYSDRTRWIAQSGVSINGAITIFNDYAKNLGLNMDQFKSDFSSKTVNDIINADIAEGQKLKITSTPTFLVNGEKIDLPNSYDDFKKLLAEAITKNGGTVPEGAVAPTPPATPPAAGATPEPAPPASN